MGGLDLVSMMKRLAERVFACASVLEVNVLGPVAAVILDPAVPDEADALAGLQRAVAIGDDVGEVDEQHLAVLCRDPAVALLIFKPTHRPRSPHAESSGRRMSRSS